MGTYDDSKIRVARKARSCAQCAAVIAKGQRYLEYRAGQRNTVVVDLDCARYRRQGGGLWYRCAAVEQLIAAEGEVGRAP